MREEMQEWINRLRTENAELKTRAVPLRIEFEPGYPEDVAFGTQRQMDRLKKWLDNMYALKAENATLRELVRETYERTHGAQSREWYERAEKALG